MDKHELMKLFKSQEAVVNERMDRLTSILMKQNESVIGISTELRDQSLKSSARNEMPTQRDDKIDEHMTLVTKMYQQVNEVLQDNAKFRVNMQQSKQDAETNSLDVLKIMKGGNEASAKHFCEITAQIRGLGDLFSKTAELIRDDNGYTRDDIDRNAKVNRETLEDLKTLVNAHGQQLIQRFQESHLGSLQMTQKLIEANKTWSESTKEWQQANQEFFKTQAQSLTSSLRDFEESHSLVLNSAVENLNCRFVDLKADVSETQAKVGELWARSSNGYVYDESLNMRSKYVSKEKLKPSFSVEVQSISKKRPEVMSEGRDRKPKKVSKKKNVNEILSDNETDVSAVNYSSNGNSTVPMLSGNTTVKSNETNLRLFSYNSSNSDASKNKNQVIFY